MSEPLHKLIHEADNFRIEPKNLSNSRNEPALDLARDWLRSSMSARPRVLGNWSDFELPTRLLEIRSSIRLRRGCELPSETKYATLSHCWGEGGVAFKLTKATLREFSDTIDQRSLPKTFEDAIIIARHLGINYLWIDALCIIQDDPVDWTSESLKMSDVYGNSFITIAASEAQNGTEGCLHPETHKFERIFAKTKSWKKEFDAAFPPPPQKQQLGIGFGMQNQPNAGMGMGFGLQAQPGKKTELKPCREDQIVEVLSPDILSDSITNSVLAQRGWALQERLLSPRILYFSRNQLVFECNDKIRCESFPDGIPWFIREVDLFRIYKIKEFCSTGPHWARLVEQYTECTLTDPRDILVAVSGMIRKAQEQRGDVCIAGIWRKNCEQELLWYRSSTTQGNPNLYTAPTWSWASSSGPVVFMCWWADSKEWFIEVLAMNVRPVGDDPLGELCGGSLSIACREMIHVRCFRSERNGRRTFDIEVPTTNVCSSGSIWLDAGDSNHLYCFLLKIGRFCSLLSPVTCGLVLVPTGKTRGQYTRIGLFADEEPLERYSPERSKVSLPDLFLNPINLASEESFTSFVDRGGKRRGVIEVI